jgi:hypothetical protein
MRIPGAIVCFSGIFTDFDRHLERMPVTLSAAKGLARRTQSSCAALRMTARTPLKSAHGKSSLQTSVYLNRPLTA